MECTKKLINLKTEILSDAGSRGYEIRLHELATGLKEYLTLDINEFSGKTGVNRERVPENNEWPYVRAASILIKCLYQRKTIKQLRSAYGGLRRRGVKPSVRCLAGGAYIRRIVQKLESTGLLKTASKGRSTSYHGSTVIAKYMKP